MTRPKRFHSKGIPARTLDLLETDGGWLTVDGVAHVLDANPESVDRAMWRLHERGLVTYRVVEMALGAPRRIPTVYASSTGTASIETRHEWRFKTWGEWDA